MSKHTSGSVSQMPWHDGDGYSWGGDVIVSFGCRAINLGSSGHSGDALKLAHLIAAAPELLEALKALASEEWSHMDDDDLAYEASKGNKMVIPYISARAAIAKAEGRS